MKDGDILWYMDAGCTLHKSGMTRFLEYIKMVHESPSGILSFRMSYKQKTWTKMDVLELFDISLSIMLKVNILYFVFKYSIEFIIN